MVILRPFPGFSYPGGIVYHFSNESVLKRKSAQNKGKTWASSRMGNSSGRCAFIVSLLEFPIQT